MTYTLRPAGHDDDEFLYELFCSSRAGEMALSGLGRPQLETLLRLQCRSQSQTYRAQFPDAAHYIVCVGGRPAGRMLVAAGEREIRLIDVALLPEHQSRGIGTSLIRGVQDRAAGAGLPVVLHVGKFNRAVRLYDRLGFAVTEDAGGHLRMQWDPRPKIGSES